MGKLTYHFWCLQLSVMEVELNSALEERNRARNDASEGSLAQDDVVSQAREDRDAAITRRTKAEIELAKTRVELMQANSQLLEAIHQKVELSQQLEQWQVRFYRPWICIRSFLWGLRHINSHLSIFLWFCLSVAQMDMHELIEDQMKKQLDDSRAKARKQITTTAAPKKTYSHLLMGLFQR